MSIRSQAVGVTEHYRIDAFVEARFAFNWALNIWLAPFAFRRGLFVLISFSFSVDDYLAEFWVRNLLNDSHVVVFQSHDHIGVCLVVLLRATSTVVFVSTFDIFLIVLGVTLFWLCTLMSFDGATVCIVVFELLVALISRDRSRQQECLMLFMMTLFMAEAQASLGLPARYRGRLNLS